MKNTQRLFIIVVMLAASWQLLAGVYIHAKAYVAQQLLLSAWDKTLLGEDKVKPWSWSDTWPVARLQVPTLEEDMIVLAGDSGRNLAFAPGYRFGTVKPGEDGASIISAHRDTHFKFLKKIKLGDEIKIQTKDGKFIYYKVKNTKIVNESNVRINMNKSNKRLVLVTCYPFDSIDANTDLRYLVFAEENLN